LAGHVEIIYFLIAPLYSLFPSPVTLLVLQSVLFTVAAVPLYCTTKRKLSSNWAALGVVGIYLMCPVAQTAVLFEFHADTLAMPILIIGLCALDRQDWWGYAVFMGLALSCKWYVAVPVVALGLVLGLQGRRVMGSITASAGLLWIVVALLVIRPTFSMDESSSEILPPGLLSYVDHYFGGIGFDTIIRTRQLRVLAAAVVYLPFLFFLGRAYPWLFVASSVAIPVLLSNGPGPSYHFGYHHYAVAVPFFLFAVIEGAYSYKYQSRSSRLSKWVAYWQLGLGFSLATTLLFNLGLVLTPLRPAFWRALRNESLDLEMSYLRTPRDAVKDEWMNMQSWDEESMAVTSHIAVHVPNREVLFTSYNASGNLQHVNIALFDALFDRVATTHGLHFQGGALYDTPHIDSLLKDKSFSLVTMRDGLLLFERDWADEELYTNVMTRPLRLDTYMTRANFDGKVQLIDVAVAALDNRRYRLVFDWVGSEGLQDEAPLFAVSRLIGVPHSRFPHLPTEVLYPTNRWKAEELVRETFDIMIPEGVEPGEYALATGWYDSSRVYAYKTDARSRVEGEFWVTLLEIGESP
jgi:hypothetical protein